MFYNIKQISPSNSRAISAGFVRNLRRICSGIAPSLRAIPVEITRKLSKNCTWIQRKSRVILAEYGKGWQVCPFTHGKSWLFFLILTEKVDPFSNYSQKELTRSPLTRACARILEFIFLMSQCHNVTHVLKLVVSRLIINTQNVNF